MSPTRTSGGEALFMMENRGPTSIETLLVEYQCADDLLSDYSENLSAGQLFVETKRTLDVGTPVHLKLSFPGLRQPLDVMGVVRWPGGTDAHTGLGIEITEPAVQRALAANVERIRAHDPQVMARLVRILVVEDNPHVARLIRNGLRGTSRRQASEQPMFDFHTARNGREALELLRSRPFDMLITDMYVPILDGAQLITAVRADQGLRRLPILAVSAGGPTAERAALDAGADHFLNKPLRLREVDAVVNRMIAR
jgi:uncharacterized protein (TIGR02266 family)